MCAYCYKFDKHDWYSIIILLQVHVSCHKFMLIYISILNNSRVSRRKLHRSYDQRYQYVNIANRIYWKNVIVIHPCDLEYYKENGKHAYKQGEQVTSSLFGGNYAKIKFHDLVLTKTPGYSVGLAIQINYDLDLGHLSVDQSITINSMK